MKKATKTKAKSKAKKCNDCKTMAWVNVVLSIILLTGAGFSIWKILDLESKVPTAIEAKKLEVFDDIMGKYINEHEIVDTGSVQEMTGYGVSDEDGAFYVTFDYLRVDEFPADYRETFDLSEVPIRHGIMYFQPSEHGSYGHAYSYHDDYYHPGGEYIRLKTWREEMLEQ